MPSHTARARHAVLGPRRIQRPRSARRTSDGAFAAAAAMARPCNAPLAEAKVSVRAADLIQIKARTRRLITNTFLEDLL